MFVRCAIDGFFLVKLNREVLGNGQVRVQHLDENISFFFLKYDGEQ